MADSFDMLWYTCHEPSIFGRGQMKLWSHFSEYFNILFGAKYECEYYLLVPLGDLIFSGIHRASLEPTDIISTIHIFDA